MIDAVWYATLNKPFFTPPSWVFGPAWTILYFLMGLSLYLVLIQGRHKKKVKIAVIYFLAQLVFNLLWSPVFFGLKVPLLALIIILIMWILILMTISKFYAISKLASYLLVPYLLWVSFATILNAAIVLLN